MLLTDLLFPGVYQIRQGRWILGSILLSLWLFSGWFYHSYESSRLLASRLFRVERQSQDVAVAGTTTLYSLETKDEGYKIYRFEEELPDLADVFPSYGLLSLGSALVLIACFGGNAFIVLRHRT